jgi:hypothetical protein
LFTHISIVVASHQLCAQFDLERKEAKSKMMSYIMLWTTETSKTQLIPPTAPCKVSQHGTCDAAQNRNLEVKSKTEFLQMFSV